MKNNSRCSYRFFITSSLVALFLMSISTSAKAALISRLGGQAVYDTDLNITWLAGTGGGYHITWYTAQAYIAGLNAVNYLGFSDWRLPTTLVPDPTCNFGSWGYTCIGSEMGHLYFTENATTSGLFTSLPTGGYAWSGTECGSNCAYAYTWFAGGGNLSFTKDLTPAGPASSITALAVRSGDVANVVPVPAAVWLFGSGLLGLVGLARRKAPWSEIH